MNIESAIRCIKDKDEAGLVFIYDHYSRALMGIISRIIGSDKIAEEVLQQTFMKIWSNIERYDHEKATFFTWMARIARNTSIDQVRLKSYKREMQIEALPASLNKTVRPVSQANIDIEMLTKTLDQKYKVVIDLIYLKGYTYVDASELLNIPVGTLKTRLRKSISILRSAVKKDAVFLSAGLLLLILIIHALWS